jgi:hypothetical protein
LGLQRGTQTVLAWGIGLTMPLRWGANNRPLREELDKIIEDYADSDERLGEQVGLIMRLASKYDASISLVRETKPGEPCFTCYQLSFGLLGVESVNRILGENWHITLGRDFVQHLVDKWLDEVSISDAKDGDHVLYIDLRIEHAGRVAQGAVESKWGKGHLWRHGVFEVPRRYGDTVKFFRHISKEQSIQAFHGYASIHGAVIADAEHGPK